jgi:curved DNA-binding protein CbpA
MSATDPYKTLQVDPEAEDEVIAAAYRRLARKYHPDVAAGPEAAARMAAINAAWESIGDPTKRAAFDRQRAVEDALQRRTTESGSSTAGAGAGGGAAAGAASAGPTAFGEGTSGAAGAPGPRPPEAVSRDWTTGRSSVGGGYDASMHTADGAGAAGPPPGNPSGSVMTFGRYVGWSLGEIARRDLEYIEWLDRMPIGRPYRDEIDTILRGAGRRRSTESDATERRGLFRRR